ncbi:MAG: hypothetical protein M1832_003093 [Thelocarpon impressellum]|nr:MAG: hypothetical protein M1832_003093 [Thelocarpon impressellum]
MDSLHSLAVRDGSDGARLTPTMVNILIALLIIVFVGLLSLVALLLLRMHRRSKEAGLPMYEEKQRPRSSNHRRLTVTATPYGRHSQSIQVYSEKQSLVESPSTASSPLTPESVPEIRITFPDEEGEGGRKTSGRVVLVRVGDTGVGLEPLREDLPPYQSSDADRFQSLDLDRDSKLDGRP